MFSCVIRSASFSTVLPEEDAVGEGSSFAGGRGFAGLVGWLLMFVGFGVDGFAEVLGTCASCLFLG